MGGCRKAEWSYSMFKIRRGSHEEIALVQGKEQWLYFAAAAMKIPHVQGKEQQLCFAGAAVKRYSTYKVRETQLRW